MPRQALSLLACSALLLTACGSQPSATSEPAGPAGPAPTVSIPAPKSTPPSRPEQPTTVPTTTPTTQPTTTLPDEATESTGGADVLAPEIGAAASRVTGALALQPAMATTYTVVSGPGVTARHRREVDAVLSVLVRLVPPSRLNGIEVYLSAETAWLGEQIAASRRITKNEQDKFVAGLASGSLGDNFTYSLRGASDEQTIAILASAYDLEDSRLAAGVAREVSINFFSVEGTGVAEDPWPCWAAEGLGYPLAWEALSRSLGGTYASWRDPWISQLRTTDPLIRLGLSASERRSGTNEHPCFLNPGVGHLQGALFAEMVLADHGLDGLVSWARASRFASWRDGLRQATGVPVEIWYARFEREALTELR
jgi:hypothetical protein